MISRPLIQLLWLFVYGTSTIYAQVQPKLSWNSVTSEDLYTYAATFPPMPESSFDLIQYVPPSDLPVTISAGSPTSDLEWTIFDSDYLDG